MKKIIIKEVNIHKIDSMMICCGLMQVCMCRMTTFSSVL